MDVWMLTKVTVIVGELVCYWALIIALAIIATMGWVLYVGANKRLKSFLSSPMRKKPNCTSVVSNPTENIDD